FRRAPGGVPVLALDAGSIALVGTRGRRAHAVRAVSLAIGEGMSVTIKQNRRHFLGTVGYDVCRHPARQVRFGERIGLSSVATTNRTDRKSTRLNSSHVAISYAVFCLKKKKKTVCSARLPNV